MARCIECNRESPEMMCAECANIWQREQEEIFAREEEADRLEFAERPPRFDADFEIGQY